LLAVLALFAKSTPVIASSIDLNRNTTILSTDKLEIKLFYLTPSVIDELFTAGSDQVKELVASKKNSGVLVYVTVLEDDILITSYLKFIQGNKSFGIRTDDIVSLSENFKRAESVVAGTVEQGIIMLPDGLDLSSPLPIDVLYRNSQSRTPFNHHVVPNIETLDSPKVLKKQLLSRVSEPQNGELTGDISIVTKDGLNIKFRDVLVSIIPDAMIRPYIKKRMDSCNRMLDALNPRRELLQQQYVSSGTTIPSPYDEQFEIKLKAWTDYNGRIKKELDYLYAFLLSLDSMSYYFSELPPNIAQTYTDAEGHFVVYLPREGNFALAAHATRAIGDTKEEYYWLVRVSLGGAATGKITLSNDNLATTAQSLKPLMMP
jgi:hypothetical protein